MKRNTLIKLCKDAVVHHTKWSNRDSFIAQKSIQSIYKGLTAGLEYKVITKEMDSNYHSTKDTIVIEFHKVVDPSELEKGLDLKISSREDYFKDCDPNYDSEMFDGEGIYFYSNWSGGYMPTRARLKRVGIGNDWY